MKGFLWEKVQGDDRWHVPSGVERLFRIRSVLHHDVAMLPPSRGNKLVPRRDMETLLAKQPKRVGRIAHQKNMLEVERRDLLEYDESLLEEMTDL